jgi:hypothetical protein
VFLAGVRFARIGAKQLRLSEAPPRNGYSQAIYGLCAPLYMRAMSDRLSSASRRASASGISSSGPPHVHAASLSARPRPRQCGGQISYRSNSASPPSTVSIS